MRWYADAHHVATAIANDDAHLGAGMLAIYSPQQGWISNVLTPLACSVNARESVDRFRDVRLDQPKNRADFHDLARDRHVETQLDRQHGSGRCPFAGFGYSPTEIVRRKP
jgi:hypothetical protein